MTDARTMDAPGYTDSEAKQEAARKKKQWQIDKLEEYKRGIINDLADCIGVFAHRRLEPPEILDAFGTMLSGVAENAHNLARDLEK